LLPASTVRYIPRLSSDPPTNFRMVLFLFVSMSLLFLFYAKVQIILYNTFAIQNNVVPLYRFLCAEESAISIRAAFNISQIWNRKIQFTRRYKQKASRFLLYIITVIYDWSVSGYCSLWQGLSRASNSESGYSSSRFSHFKQLPNLRDREAKKLFTKWKEKIYF
jgi:hypothetical protein